jgi:subtilase family serine protease
MKTPIRVLISRVTPLAASALLAVASGPGARVGQATGVFPLVAEYQLITSSETPPTESQCFSVGRRCFAPAAMQNAYNVTPLLAKGDNGAGQTIVIVDSFGSDTIRHDLHVFNNEFGLQHMCGEEGVTCASGMPSFDTLELQGSPATKAPPSTSNGTGLENKNAWGLEVSLDVEWSHSIAPGANILLVTTPTAETLGVQGFPQMMSAEQFVIDNHLGSVISQSFGAGEESFHSGTGALDQLRKTYISAQAAGVTVLASSGDGGTSNTFKEPVKNPQEIPFPSVIWPASDPLVTAVGGTYLCVDPVTGAGADSADPPRKCQANPGQREVGWVDSGGGFSHVFGVPSFQNTLPAGSTPVKSGRGVPDVSYQASSFTGVLVYITLDGYSGIGCPGGMLCSRGWYVVGGTSSGSPQWAGLVAIADQLNGGPLGYLNPALYKIGSDPLRYANDFYDVTTGINKNPNPASSLPGYPATIGWDPVTGLGSPNAANLLPDLVMAVHGH